MTQRVLALLALAGILLAQGFHVAALQGVAWTRMYLDYQQQLPAMEAISQTLDGKELCGVCQLSINLKDKAQDAVSDYVALPTPPLALQTEEEHPLRAPSPTLSKRRATHPRSPEHCILEQDTPPPRSSQLAAA